MTDYAVTEWRYSYIDLFLVQKGRGFTSRQAAIDDLCAKVAIDEEFAKRFVYSIVVPLSSRERNSEC